MEWKVVYYIAGLHSVCGTKKANAVTLLKGFSKQAIYEA